MFHPDSVGSTTPGGGGGVDQTEGGQGDGRLVQELWFIVVLAGIALLLLAVVLGVVLHKVREKCSNTIKNNNNKTICHYKFISLSFLHLI